MSAHGGRKGTPSDQARSKRPRKAGRSAGPARSTEPGTTAGSRLGNLTAYVGYVGAVVLIYQTINGFSERPAFGFTWSPALLGVVLAAVTAVFRDELHLRSRLKVFDEETASRLVVSLAWGGLGVIAIFGIMTFPRF